MKAKTIFIIIVSVLITIILMKNTGEVNFWMFGDMSLSMLAILATFFSIGLIFGYLLGRPGKKQTSKFQDDENEDSGYSGENEIITENRKNLSDEDREYIS